MLPPTVAQRTRHHSRTHGRNRWSAAALGLAMLALTSSIVRAQDDAAAAQAKEHFQAGVTAYEVGDYPGALKEFQEAFRLKPHPMVRVNMANCYDNLDKPVEAIFHFEKFMAAPEGTADQRKEVREALKRLRQRVGAVTIRVAPDGALVQIDDEETRKAPILDEVLLKAGSHQIRASLEGYATVERSVNVAGGQPANVDITLEPQGGGEPDLLAGVLPPMGEEAAPPPEGEGTVDVSAVAPLTGAEEPAADEAPEANAEAPESGGGRRLSTPVIIVGSATLALAVVATVTGIMALGANSDFDEAAAIVNDPDSSAVERHDAHQDAIAAADKADALALTTDLLLVGAVIGAGVTTILWLVSGSSAESAHLELRPSLARKAGGLVLSGDF